MADLSLHHPQADLNILIERLDGKRDISLRTIGKVVSAMDRLIQIAVIDSISEITDDPDARIQARRAVNRAFLDPTGGLLVAGPVEIHSWELFALMRDVTLWLQMNGVIVSGVLTNVLSAAIIHGPSLFIKSVKLLRQMTIESEGIPVDPALIAPLLNLAEIVDKGQVRVRLSSQGIDSLIDNELFTILARIRNDSNQQTIDPPLAGTVVGSDMDDRRIDVYFPNLGTRLPCYYLSFMQRDVQRYTEDGTPVTVYGSLWVVRYKSKPWKIDLTEIK